MGHQPLDAVALAPQTRTAVNTWLRSLTAERRMSAHTVAAYQHDVAGFLGFTAHHIGGAVSVTALNDLRTGDFRAWLAHRRHQEHAGPRTLARGLSAVRSFFRYLAREGLSDNAHIALVRTPKQPRTLPKALDEDKTTTVLAAIDPQTHWTQARDLALITLLYGAGLRINEAISLNAEDWPARGASLRVIGKGGKTRMVPLLAQVHDAVDAYRTACPHPLAPRGPLFVGVRGGRLHPRLLQKTFAQLRRALNLPDSATPHALRHSFATHLLKAGGDLRTIQELLGHARLSSTQIYAQVEPSHLLAVYDKAQAVGHKRAPR